jgi:hypothetical protein
MEHAVQHSNQPLGFFVSKQHEQQKLQVQDFRLNLLESV